MVYLYINISFKRYKIIDDLNIMCEYCVVKCSKFCKKYLS